MPDSLILGVGLDVVEVARVRASVRRSGERFSQRVFTPAEIAYCAGRARKFEHLAARFAAKEATLKALGTGITGWASLQEVEVVHDAAGRPEIRLRGGVLRRARSLGLKAAHLSISHTAGVAAAVVVLEGGGRRRGLG
ncbi:MAG: holo-ACP synthase [Candidatus Brocadiia bacterium]|jgi:holo-[acyl-carrier protein] synthase